MSELMFNWVDFDVQMIFTNLRSIFWTIIVYITYLQTDVIIDNKIKIEQRLFRFLSTTCRTMRRRTVRIAIENDSLWSVLHPSRATV